MPPKKEESKKEKKKEFVWSDDEAELLLNVANDYKVSKAAESVDWESVKSKYDDICDLFIAALPENNNCVMKDFPHKKEQITKQIVSSKLKAIRLKFRQAVDSGRRSGHGRVVMIFYELCEKVWGGSPATEQIDGGIESTELVPKDMLDSQGDTSSNIGVNADIPVGYEILSNGNPLLDEEEEDTEESNEGRSVPTKETVKQRREFLDDKLKNYKQEKMKRKLPVDTQLLGCAQEELQIKKRLVEQMDKMDKKYAENMERMSSNMEKLTESISDGFALLKQMMMYQQPPPGMYHPQSSFHPYMQGSPHLYNNRMPSYPSSSSSTPPSPNFDMYEN